MAAEDPTNQIGWTEDVSRQFLDYGRYLVPGREHQAQLMVALLAGLASPAAVVELCCGEGLLAEAILETYPAYSILAFDGSPTMLDRARRRLARFGPRFSCHRFDLASSAWRNLPDPVHAVVSSLAIHHLLGPAKQALLQDVFRMLAPGGRLVIADILEVPGAFGRRVAADEWDEAVRRRSLELDGNTTAFDFFRSEGWNTHRYLDPDDIDKPSPLFDQLKWLESAGFVEVDVYWLLAGHAIFGGQKPTL